MLDGARSGEDENISAFLDHNLDTQISNEAFYPHSLHQRVYWVIEGTNLTTFSWTTSLSKEISRMAVEGTPSDSI